MYLLGSIRFGLVRFGVVWFGLVRTRSDTFPRMNPMVQYNVFKQDRQSGSGSAAVVDMSSCLRQDFPLNAAFKRADKPRTKVGPYPKHAKEDDDVLFKNASQLMKTVR